MVSISSAELVMGPRARPVKSLSSVHGSGPNPAPSKDYFIERDGALYAGTQLIIDLRGASHLDDLEHIEDALREAVEASGATLLHIHLHHFTPNGGVSGVAVLAESHISIHTWPERSYAAVDVFMCGVARPERTLEVFERAFRPEKMEVAEHLRGRCADSDA
jgi:S-adenosylmethionine decarboxylase